jgi:hypothetical protein
MTAPLPLPLTYRKGRSLVDRTRVRWAGVGNLVLGGLLVIFGGLGATIVGLMFVVLGLAAWIVSGFGGVPFGQLSRGKKTVVVIASVGYLVVVVISAIWGLAKKVVDTITRRPHAEGPKPK